MFLQDNLYLAIAQLFRFLILSFNARKESPSKAIQEIIDV